MPVAAPSSPAPVLDAAARLRFYRALVRPRLVEEKMLSLLRQGRVSKWFAGIGQEAIGVGCALALDDDEWMFTMHRNLGVFTTREVPLARLFAQWQGKPLGYTAGRDRSFHFGAREHRICGMISHLGPQLSLAAGVGLAHVLAGERKVALAFTGDGGTSEGEFHEALNLAAVWRLPVIFVVENNGYGLSTPVRQQYACESLADRAAGYGMEGRSIDGNDVLEVYRHVAELATSLRDDPRPALLECRTFRMRGHEEASGVKYVPDELLAAWAERDPVERLRTALLADDTLTPEADEALRADIRAEIETALAEADASPAVTPDLARELTAVYAPTPPSTAPLQPSTPTAPLRFVDAVSLGLADAMEAYPGLVLMGQDIAEYGGVFKVTDGFAERFGGSRVRNTPLCESAVVGAALGYHLASGQPAMVEMQFSDFATCGFNQIVNYLAKLHYRWGQTANVVVRMPCGGGVGAGPFHSQTNEAWFAHTPGLRVVYPSTPADARGLLLSSFDDPNPVLFFEHKGLYRSLEGEVPEAPARVPLGEARVVRAGAEATIVTYGLGVRWAEAAVAETGRDVEVVDLRTLAPLDTEAVLASARKTGRVVVAHEDTLVGGFGAELAALITEHAFEHLDAPVMRVGSAETPVPFAGALEADYLGEGRLVEALARVLSY